MTDYKEILRLASLGINKSKIAESMEITRPTVISTLHRAARQGLTWELAQFLSERELQLKLSTPLSPEAAFKQPDFEQIRKELQKPGVTQQLLWEEYCQNCRQNGGIPYSLSQFKYRFREEAAIHQATMHIVRKPGELTEVDWAGQTAQIIDSDTGEVITAYLFVAALPFSGYSYAEAFLDRKEGSWITAHINAFSYFGGVTKMLVPDNLKTGVIKNIKEELILNKTYYEMAEHYGTAIIPTRVRSPKDKATVEGTVGIVSTQILAAVRNEKFFSLYELNKAVKDKLAAFNNKMFSRKDGSRFTLFAEERQYLLPLPVHHFEISEWKLATVQYNYHVSVEFMNYSVPFEYIRKRVDVRLTRAVVEIFYESVRIASHRRLYGKPGQYSTADEHMPENHKQYVKWNGARFREWAGKIGEKTAFVVNSLLTCNRVEQQGYKSCMSILNLAEQYSAKRLEAACAKALQYTPRPGYKQILNILKSGDLLTTEAAVPSKTDAFSFVRGADYYKGGTK